MDILFCRYWGPLAPTWKMSGLKAPVLVVCILLELLGFAIFLRGFLVLKSSVPGHAVFKDQPSEPGDHGPRGPRPPAQYGRLVVVLIDALRSDFVFPDNKSNLLKMQFLSKVAATGSSLSFQAKAHPPTVTMPRIKVHVYM